MSNVVTSINIFEIQEAPHGSTILLEYDTDLLGTVVTVTERYVKLLLPVENTVPNSPSKISKYCAINAEGKFVDSNNTPDTTPILVINNVDLFTIIVNKRPHVEIRQDISEHEWMEYLDRIEPRSNVRPKELNVKLVYRPANTDYIKRVLVTGSTLREILYKMIINMFLYFETTDEIENAHEEDILSDIINTNGHPFDEILLLKNITTGEVYISDEYAEYDIEW